jgi:hypothetical protein
MASSALRHLMRTASTRQTLRRGYVFKARLPQDISSSAHLVNYKPRPFIVMDEEISFPVDDYGFCRERVTMLGVGATTQDGLVRDRPHVKFHISGEPCDSHAWLDSLRTEIFSPPIKFDVIHKLSTEDLLEARTGLDSILRQETRFDRFVSTKKFAPGQIWTVRTATAVREGFIILRRGRFLPDDDPQHPRTTPPERQDVPFLVALFRDAEKVTTLHNLTWEDVKITALPENAFMRREGAMQIETIDIFLNSIRRQVGVKELSLGDDDISNSRFAILSLYLLRPLSLLRPFSMLRL